LCNNARHEIPILNLVVVFLLFGTIKLCVFAQRLGCWGDLTSGALPVVPYSPLSVSVARKICWFLLVSRSLSFPVRHAPQPGQETDCANDT